MLIKIICIFIIFSIFIRFYINDLKKKYKNEYSCYDKLNKTLLQIGNLKFCGWNIIHIILYFILTVVIKAKLNLNKHIYVFYVGLFWYTFAPYSIKKMNIIDCSNDIVYQDIYKPRLDDLVFNFLGQLFYIILYKLFFT